MKKNKLLFALVFVFAAVIAAGLNGGLANAPTGCCYNENPQECIDYYEFGEEACESVQGNEYFPNTECEDVAKCDTGCCCQGNQPLFTLRGVCQKLGLAYTQTPPSACTTAFCTGTTPDCQPDCIINNGLCRDVSGEVIDASQQYYCRNNDKMYDFQGECVKECSPPPPNCIRGQSISSASPCICQGTRREFGFCCPDGSYRLQQTDCPLSTNSCTDAGYTCAKGCASGSHPEHDANAPPGAIDRCPPDTPRCCEQPAPTPVDCCETGESCPGTVLPYTYSDCNEGLPDKRPCTGTCSRLACTPNFRINSPANQNSESITDCFCGGIAYPLATETRFCCADGSVSSTGCEAVLPGRVAGTVLQVGTSGTKVGGVLVEVFKLSQLAFSHTTEGTGTNAGTFDFGGLEPGNYLIRASKAGFVTKEISQSIAAGQQVTGLIIWLSPGTLGNCESLTPPAPTNVDAQPVKGERKALLAWGNPCSGSINEFLITRNPAHPLGTIVVEQSATSYADENVSWGGTYTYTIKAHYASNVFSAEASDSLIMGNELCEGITEQGDSDNKKLCLTSTLDGIKPTDKNNLIYRCENNNLVYVSECTNGGACASDQNGNARCTNAPNCNEVPPFSPFGLFYENESCEGGDSRNNYCYYDYSFTTIDRCNSCEGKTCFDYKSKNACIEDTCGASLAYRNNARGNIQGGVNGGGNGGVDSFNAGCKWTDLAPEFGKGICSDPDFEGKKCGRCNTDTGSVFYNSKCTQEVCSSLGACYSNTTSCFSCQESTTCEDYKNKEACVGPVGNEQGYEFGTVTCQHPISITPSNDACGKNVCKWDITSNRCIKDANDDNVWDCYDPANRASCISDTTAPRTIPQSSIPNMGSAGQSITFTSSQDAKSFYYCIDQSNSCCSFNQILFGSNTPNTLSVNPAQDPNVALNTEGKTYFIRYYAVDSHNNVEQVKSAEFYIDRKGPDLTLDHSTTQEAGGTSTLRFTLQANEFVSCTKTIAPTIESTKITLDEFSTGQPGSPVRVNNLFQFRAEGLQDNAYLFTATCQDDAGNSNTAIASSIIDTFEQSRNPLPQSQIFKTPAVRIYIETSDPVPCTYQQIYPAPPTLPGPTPSALTQTRITDENFTHTATVTVPADGEYHYQIECTSPTTGMKDKAFAGFTVDRQAPSTEVTEQGALFNFNAYHKTPVILSFRCVDPNLGNQPGEFGCGNDAVKYCTGSPGCIPASFAESPTTVTLSGSQSQFLNFRSTDRGGNEQPIQAKTILVDNIPPQLIFPTPAPRLKASTIRLQGTATDGLSGMEKVTLIVAKKDEPTNYHLREANGGSFNEAIDLFAGENIIIVEAKDRAGNRREVSAVSLNDNDGPSMNPQVSDHLGQRIDDKQTVLSGEEPVNASYLKPITLTLTLEDAAGVKDGTAALRQCAIGDTTSCTGAIVGNFILEPLGGGVFSKQISNILDVGKYQAVFSGLDNFNNANSSTLFFFVSDHEAPTLAFSILRNGQPANITSLGDFLLKVNATEPLSSIATTYEYVNAVDDTVLENPPGILVKEAAVAGADDGIWEIWEKEITIVADTNNNGVEGPFKINFNALDNNGNSISGTNTQFIINTTGPAIERFAPEIPEVAYSASIKVGGFTEPGADVIINVFSCSDADGEDCATGPSDTLTVTAEMPSAAKGIVNRATTLNKQGRRAGPGATEIFFTGDHTGKFTPPGETFYLDFEPDTARALPRYEIESYIIDGGKTKLVISPGLRFDEDANPLLGSNYLASTYTVPYPEGYFIGEITLNPGFNSIEAYAVKDDKVGASSFAMVEYDNIPFTISVDKPGDSVINLADFQADSNAMELKVKTTRAKGSQIEQVKANCNISHTEDVIARAFANVQMNTPGSGVDSGVTHTYTANSNSCVAAGGKYCIIGGTSSYPINYHHYNIRCDPTELPLPTATKEVCFTAATYGGALPNIVGQNICAAATCGTGTPAPVPCPQASCSSFTTASMCANNGCVFCPGGASTNSNSCLSSCSTCGGLTFPSGGQCTTATVGGGTGSGTGGGTGSGTGSGTGGGAIITPGGDISIEIR